MDQHNTKFHGKRKCEEDTDYTEGHKHVRIAEGASPPVAVEEVVTQETYLPTSELTQGDYCKPSRFSKDPLRGFFQQTVVECAECKHRPTKKFSTNNAWQLHMKTFHKHIKSIGQYKQLHGDPDLVKFKHECRVCGLQLILNLNVVKRHLQAQHNIPSGT